MTEQEWLTSSDPLTMLRHLEARAIGSDRRLRLFCCCCVRLGWHLLDDERCRRAVEVAELFADGKALSEDRGRAWSHAREAVAVRHNSATYSVWGLMHSAWRCTALAMTGPGAGEVVMDVGSALRHSIYGGASGREGGDIGHDLMAAVLRDVAGNPWKPIVTDSAYVNDVLVNVRVANYAAATTLQLDFGAEAAYRRAVQECVVPQRCITADAKAIALAAYDDLDGDVPCLECGGTGGYQTCQGHGDVASAPCRNCHGRRAIAVPVVNADRLLVLADALEEAGCESADLLTHLRGRERCPRCDGSGWVAVPKEEADDGRAWAQDCPMCDDETAGTIPLRGPHVRGCWALDLVLGKS